jgi:hypothetical protein
MKTFHKIYLQSDDEVQKILQEFGITVEKGFTSFQIEENAVFRELEPYLKSWEASDFSVSTFDKSEEENAKHLVFMPGWQTLYPRPEDDYFLTTYDDSNLCRECGVGAVQKEPFRVSQTPKWGNKMFVLHWVFDEIFCQKELYEQVFKDKLDFLPLLKYKTDTVIEDTVQLVLPITDSALKLDGCTYEICEMCQRKRYDLINAGFFPSFEKKPPKELHLFKSKEWFGTGGDGRKYMFITQELRKELIKHKVRGRYHPQLE